MQKRLWRTATGILALAAVVGAWSDFGSADDQQDEKKRVQRREVRVRLSENHAWLGVALAPVGETLKAQLGIEHGVIVQQVFPDSPAGRAGLMPHDVVLKYGERDVDSAEDLQEAVRAGKEDESTVTVLRRGQKQTFKIRPEVRPGDVLGALEPGAGEDPRRLLEKWLHGPDSGVPLKLRFLGPGLLYDRGELKPSELPANLSISITKEGDKPARIVVKQEDKTWEITEDGLGELPAEIRTHVQRMLGGGHPGGPLLRLKSLTPDENGEGGEAEEDHVWQRQFAFPPQQFREMMKSFEEIRRQWEGNSFEDLRREIESLRRELEQLRPSPSDDTNDA